MKLALYSFAHPHAFGYLKILKAQPDVEILATDPDARYAPSREVRGKQAAREHGVDYVDTVDELLEWGPDGVLICSENSRHREAVETFAKAGVHILCEKPIATTRKDAEAMVRVASECAVTLMIAYPVRFSSAFNALNQSVSNGLLGDLRSIAGANNGQLPSDRDWFSDRQLSGGGAIMDHTVHIADLLDALMPNARAISVYALANKITDRDRAQAETGGLLSIKYDNGVIATIDCSWSIPAHNPVWGGLNMQVLGTDGIATMDAFDSQLITGFSEVDRLPVRIDYGVDANSTMIEAFLEAIKHNEQVQPDGSSGVRSLAIALSAYESLESGTAVSVE